MDQLWGHQPVTWLCRRLGVARSGYYGKHRQQAPMGQRQADNALIAVEIHCAPQQRQGFQGSPCIHKDLLAAGRSVGRNRIARLMQYAGLRTKPGGRGGPAPRPPLVPPTCQKAGLPASSRCWTGDITCIRTTAGWRYLTVELDLFSSRIVGWRVVSSMEASLVL